jgi:type VI secretion system VgrG family protein
MWTTLRLEIEDVESSLLTPFVVHGTEALSTLYDFEVGCTASNRLLLGADVLGRSARLVIAPYEGAERTISGIVSHIQIKPPTIVNEVVYSIRIAPWMSRLALSRHNHVFGTETPVSAVDVIELELKGAARRKSLAAEQVGPVFQHELRLSKAYPAYHQIVQYEETNLAFISRLAEHWGLFYFFHTSGGQDRVVFADDNVFAPLLEGGDVLTFQPWIEGTHISVPNCIYGLEADYDPAPARLFLRDYNERMPDVALVVSRPMDPVSREHWVEYGAHYRTPDEGALLADVRAEEMLCRRVRFSGRSTAVALAPGRVFTLRGHPYAEWNQRYLLTSVRHVSRVAHPSIAANPNEPSYANEFTAIPLKVQFRPQRVTPRPRVDGLLNGRVEAPKPTAPTQPNLDERGYYRVRLPVDMSDAPSGLASQWVRKAEPYGGPSNGMHFPLPAGTDVVLAYVNGDPDRPIIVGAVPSADNRAVVDSGNQRMNRIQSRSGVQITMADMPPPEAANN